MKMTAFGETETKALRILSIDWDVFHDMTQFMPGAMACQVDWVVEYSRWEGEFQHSYEFAYAEFEQVKRYLSAESQTVFIAEDHKKLYDVIKYGSKVELTNLDFHCDLALCERLNKLDCGNWISALAQYKKCEILVDWHQLHTKDPDGKLEHYRGEMDHSVPYKHYIGFDGVFEKKYDIIFLCQSSDFSPPHMNHRFRELLKTCQKCEGFVDSEPFYPTYSERVEYASQFDSVYIPTGVETDEEMDTIYDDHDNLVVYPVSQIEFIPDCDPVYRR